MTYLLINIVLALVWVLLWGDPTMRGFLIGFVLGYFALLPYRRTEAAGFYSYRVVYLVRFAVLFMWALWKSSIEVSWEILTRTHYMRPGIVAIDIAGMTPLAVFILANAISLTPGTVSLAISRERKELYIHAMYADEPERVVADVERWLKQPLLLVIPPTAQEGKAT